MKKLILFSFGFMGWVFYVMSGGADFQPASVRATAQTSEQVEQKTLDDVSEVVVADLSQSSTAPKSAFADTNLALRDDDVTRVALNLTTLRDPSNQSETTALEPQPAALDRTDLNAVPVNAGYTTASADTPAIIPSLIVSGDAGANQQTVSSNVGYGDIRIVTGTRVNVRGGPGTNYGVVTKLGAGDSVEIIEDDGQGWVKMRPVDGGPEGWMADFLLVNG